VACNCERENLKVPHEPGCPAASLEAPADRTIVVYYDDTSDPANHGWVTRCTEFDGREQAILGRIAMDEQLDATTLDEALREAAEHWGCSPDTIELYQGNLG
jgi:hypothetical protein